MRILLLLTGCCLALTTHAQSPQQHLRIQISYEKSGQYLEQAIETIEATNTVNKTSTVEYRAGQSVSLLPGFEAKAGSTFTANVRPVSGSSEVSLQLNAFPNPFEQSTTIDYTLPADGKVNVWISDAQGKIVGQLIQDEVQSAGKHQIEWKPTSAGAGVYMPVVEHNQQKVTGRLVKK